MTYSLCGKCQSRPRQQAKHLLSIDAAYIAILARSKRKVLRLAKMTAVRHAAAIKATSSSPNIACTGSHSRPESQCPTHASMHLPLPPSDQLRQLSARSSRRLHGHNMLPCTSKLSPVRLVPSLWSPSSNPSRLRAAKWRYGQPGPQPTCHRHRASVGRELLHGRCVRPG